MNFLLSEQSSSIIGELFLFHSVPIRYMISSDCRETIYCHEVAKCEFPWWSLRNQGIWMTLYPQPRSGLNNKVVCWYWSLLAALTVGSGFLLSYYSNPPRCIGTVIGYADFQFTLNSFRIFWLHKKLIGAREMNIYIQ